MKLRNAYQPALALALLFCLWTPHGNAATREYTAESKPIIAAELVRAPSTDARDFEGTWGNAGMAHFQIEGDPPLTAAARATRDHRLEMQRQGTLVASPHILCRPAGMISTWTNIFPTRVVQTQDKIKFFFEEVRGVRTLRIGGRHPDTVQPSYYGDSVAHWEGNVLVVDTIGFNGRGWLDNMAMPTSLKLHVVERISKSADGTLLNFAITIEDPETFTAPVELQRQWSWQSGVRQLPADCEENPSEDQVEGIRYEDDYLRPVCLLKTDASGNTAIRCEQPSER